jgi:hypothetical protein
VPLDELGSVGPYSGDLLPKNGSVSVGYRFAEVSVDPNAGTFEFKAEPLDETRGTRAFTVTEDGVVRAGPGIVAPPGKSGTPLSDARSIRQEDDYDEP